MKNIFIKTEINQWLLCWDNKKMKFINKGRGASAFLNFGNYVIVDSNQQGVVYKFLHETYDFISTRFKGHVVYRVIDPIQAVNLYIENNTLVHEKIIEQLMNDVYENVRDHCSRLSFDYCNQKRIEIALKITESLSSIYSEFWLKLEVHLDQVYPEDPDIIKMKAAEEIQNLKLNEEKEIIKREEIIGLTNLNKERNLLAQTLELEQEKKRQDEILTDIDHNLIMKTMSNEQIQKNQKIKYEISHNEELRKFEEKNKDLEIHKAETAKIIIDSEF